MSPEIRPLNTIMESFVEVEGVQRPLVASVNKHGIGAGPVTVSDITGVDMSRVGVSPGQIPSDAQVLRITDEKFFALPDSEETFLHDVHGFEPRTFKLRESDIEMPPAFYVVRYTDAVTGTVQYVSLGSLITEDEYCEGAAHVCLETSAAGQPVAGAQQMPSLVILYLDPMKVEQGSQMLMDGNSSMTGYRAYSAYPASQVPDNLQMMRTLNGRDFFLRKVGDESYWVHIPQEEPAAE